MIEGVLRKTIINLEDKNSEKFGNNNADNNVPRAFAKI
jgi:hypothetical protein